MKRQGSMSSKTIGLPKTHENQRIVYIKVANSLVLKIKDIMIFDAEISCIYSQKLNSSVSVSVIEFYSFVICLQVV